MSSLILQSSKSEMIAKFSAISTLSDVAEMLDVTPDRLRYYLYIVDPTKSYHRFEIKKSAGGSRSILAPRTALKILQRKLNQILQAVYETRARGCVTGFRPSKSIVDNARMHCGKAVVFSIDLEDFFPSINFGRVRGLFIAKPYSIAVEAATILAQICCFDNQLPQGAPTSPVVSNMICSRLDGHISRLARDCQVRYSRYADDMVFSWTYPHLPEDLAELDSERKVRVGKRLANIITENGFIINERKVRLRTRAERQSVTGLTVNEKPNVERRLVRQVRAMIYAWRRFGYEAAEQEFLAKYNTKQRLQLKQPPSYAQVLRGKLEFIRMVRGEYDPLYGKLLDSLADISPEVAKSRPRRLGIKLNTKAKVFTEGKTDWRHLKAALVSLRSHGEYTDLELEFDETDLEAGDSQRMRQCKEVSLSGVAERPMIYVFDRDDKTVVKNACSETGEFREWGNSVYSFPIPIPTHRTNTPDISLEFYYKDEEIIRKDKLGRRLFIAWEFHSDSGLHKKDEDLHCMDRNKVVKDVVIIDDQVYDRKKGKEVALSKAAFAEYVYTGDEMFQGFDFTEFNRIFDKIVTILRSSQQ